LGRAVEEVTLSGGTGSAD